MFLLGIQPNLTYSYQNSGYCPSTETAKASHGFERSVLSLSEHVLTDSEESVLNKGFNFGVTNRESNFDIACAAESVRSKFRPAFGIESFEEFHACWKNQDH